MNIKDSNIDNGKVFDWGRTSHDYAKYRDIYPDEFYRRITDRGLCVSGQSVLDIGTGTGVIPRNTLRCKVDRYGYITRTDRTGETAVAGYGYKVLCLSLRRIVVS